MGDRGNAENGENEADGGEGSGVSRRVVGGSGLNVLPEGEGPWPHWPTANNHTADPYAQKDSPCWQGCWEKRERGWNGMDAGGDLYVNVVQNSGDSEQTGFLVLVLARVATGRSPRLCSRWPWRAQAVVWGGQWKKTHGIKIFHSIQTSRDPGLCRQILPDVIVSQHAWESIWPPTDMVSCDFNRRRQPIIA